MSDISDELVIQQTRCWIEKVVIGLGLCPFASPPFYAERISYRCCHGSGANAIYRDLLLALDDLIQSFPEEVETSFMICPSGLNDFSDYLDLLEQIEDALQETGLDGMVQVASFHPDYVFAGVAEDAPENYTNRSPYPMFHLLREDSLSAALASYPNPEGIPLRNVRLLKEMGLEALKELRNSCIK